MVSNIYVSVNPVWSFIVYFLCLSPLVVPLLISIFKRDKLSSPFKYVVSTVVLSYVWIAAYFFCLADVGFLPRESLSAEYGELLHQAEGFIFIVDSFLIVVGLIFIQFKFAKKALTPD